MSAAQQLLQQHLDRLRVPHAGVQAAAVAGVFDALARAPSLPGREHDAAVRQCLSSEHKAQVEAAVQALLQLPAPLPPSQSSPQDLLLTALSVCGSGTAAVLAGGIIKLFERQLGAKSTTAPASAAPRSHPLYRALLSNPAAAQPLVLGAARLLTEAAEQEPAASFSRCLAALRPFLSCVLLDPQLSAAQLLLPLQLHSALARVACTCSSGAAQLELLRLLAAHLPAMLLAPGDGGGSATLGPQLAAAAAAAVAEVVEVVESCTEEPDEALVADLAAGLVCLSHDAAAAQEPALLQQVLAALRQLSAHWPSLLLPHAATLGTLLLQHPAQAPLGTAETRAALALLSSALQHLAGAPSGCHRQGLLPALLLLPMLQLTAFSSSKDVKQWSAHVLAHLQKLSNSPSGSGPAPTSGAPAGVRLHGPAAAAQAAEQLLHRLWHRPLEARHWLASLQLSLAGPPAGGSSGGGSRAVRDQQQLEGGVLLVLCALLQHGEEGVQRAALRAVGAALQATPLLGLSLLPLLVHELQRQVEAFLSGKRQTPSRVLLDLLRTLPEAGRHPAALPFVLRTLQPLFGAGTPEVLQAAGLRLLCRLWHTSGGRAYPQLRTAIIGYAAPGSKPGLALRAARAECLRVVCAADPDKGAELVGLIQDCLCDEAPGVQAVGLDCVALLCEADVLEFYAAWRAVHRHAPRLPEHPAAAAAWVRLLGGGGLDATVQPDTAAAVVDALWLSADHESPQVRCQAYASLAAFPLETLEGIDALRPLWSHVALLQRELRRQQEQGQGSGGTRRQRQAAQQALEECEALVQAALAYEHATRRRTGAASAPAAGPDRRRGGAAAASGAGAAALSHRLQSVLPKQLLGGAAATAGDLLQRLPEVPAAAVLYFYAPPPPPSSSKATAAAAARQAAADYQAVYAELLRQPPVALNAAEDAVEAAQTLAAWAAFLRRWLAAVRAAAKQEAADAQRAAAEAAMQVWAAMQPHLDGGAATPAAAANTAWAAAALCGCTLQPLPTLLTAVQGSLSAVASGGPQHPAAAQRAALAALGALAEGARAALGDPILQQLMHLFQRHLAAHQSEPATAAAAATALGLACRALACPGGAEAATAGQLSAAAERQLRSGLASLLTLLCTAWPAGSGAIQAAASAAGFPVSPTAGASAAADLFPAVASALAAALQPTTASLPMPALLQALHRQLLTDGAHQPGAAAMRLLQAATAAGFKTEALGSGDVGSTLSLLLGHFGSSAGAARPDGRVSGAAAAAAASLLAEALQQGLSPADEQSPAAVLQLLVAAPAAASKLPQAAAAKRGAAEGLAALLAAGAIDPGSADAKTAVAALEGLARKEADPRARRACALPLAALCYAAKRSGGLAGGAGRDTADAGAPPAAARALQQQLSADGALRPLLESLLEGRWVLPAVEGEEAAQQQQHLTAQESASLLRCLAPAERLPALNYGSLCRRLLRAHAAAASEAGDASQQAAAVETAVVAFTAAQGSRQQQQYHLAELAAELLAPRHLAAAVHAMQLSLLQHLPRLLAALPEAQAADALRGVCQHVSQQAAAAAAGGPGSSGQPWGTLLQLMGSLDLLLDGSSATAPSPSLQAAAQQALLATLLALLPSPGLYPLALLARQPGTGSDKQQQEQRLLSPQQRCWSAALSCLQQLPAKRLEGVLADPTLLRQLPMHAAYAAAALVAAGTLDARSLQHPRNLLLAGSSLPAWQQRRIAAFVGRAVGSLPAERQQQWTLDALDAVKACDNPAGALALASSVAASSAAAGMQGEQVAAGHLLVGASFEVVLPVVLPQLLKSMGQQSRGAASTALLLQRLVAALERSGAATGGQAQLLSCLLACRHSLPVDMWPLLCSIL